MKKMKALNIIKAILSFGIFTTHYFTSAQDIIFGDGNPTADCHMPSGKKGTCTPVHDCLIISNQIADGDISNVDLSCGFQDSFTPLICCPKEEQITSKGGEIYDVLRPDDEYLRHCGFHYFDTAYDVREIYKENETAENFKKMGFTVTPLLVDEDLLEVYEISNGTFRKEISNNKPLHGVGGQAARKIVTVYMAILGNRVKKVLNWFCDGVIINRNWILSAAHCFLDTDPDIVRLGDFDISNDTVTSTEFPMDFGVKRVIIHPEYDYPSALHDLALLELDAPILYHRVDMRPICLPWGQEVDRNLVGEQITLTGWGATIFGGATSPVIQEVNITVLETAMCEQNYSTLPDYPERFPNGMRSSTILCAGDVEGGKDSCQGDSGGPVVYVGNDNRFTLAGIVSTGFGCGLKGFPGIYMPINSPKYLSWIKKVAFG